MTAGTSRPARVGLVDVGSNAVRTRLVEIEDGVVRTLLDRRTAIRVGREVFVNGALSASTIAAVAVALERFRGQCDRAGAETILAVATAAARAARNGAELCGAARAAGVDLQIIDGAREAALLHAAVEGRVPLPGQAVLVDLGAGSLEIVALADGCIVGIGSYPLGSLLLLDALDDQARDRLGGPLLAAIDALIAARGGAAAALLAGVRTRCLVGIGSGIDVLADLHHADQGVSGQSSTDLLPVAALHAWRTRLALLSPDERQRRHGLSPDRADLVVVALSVFAWLVQRVEADEIVVPRVSLRDGLLAEWLRQRS